MSSTLKIYLDSKAFPELKELYATAARKHNADIVNNSHCDSGFDIYIPDGEKQFISEAENFWKNSRIYIFYGTCSDYNTVRKNIKESWN